MAGGFDIQLLGDKELERKLARLTGPKQRRAISRALRASAKRTRQRMVAKLSGSPVGVRSGRLRAAYSRAKIRVVRARGAVKIGVINPTREALGIDPRDDSYYPAALEYGSRGQPPRSFIRAAVDEHSAGEIAAIGREIGREIERMFKS